MKKKSFYLWAIPAKPIRRRIFDLILEYNKVYNTCYFPGHMTLAFLPSKLKISDAVQIAINVSEFLPITTRVLSIESENTFSRTLHLKLAKSEELLHWAGRVKELLPEGSVWDLDQWMPHISLLYLDPAERPVQVLDAARDLISEDITFDEMMLLRTPASVESNADQLEWEFYKLSD